MAKVTGTLTLTLHEAKELAQKDVGKQDPYAKISLKDEHFKTKTHKKGNSKATWGQSFLFNLKDYDHKEIVHIQVWDEDLVSDDKIGRADLTLQQIVDLTDEKDGKWIQIVDFNNFHKITGYVRLSATTTGTGWPADRTPHPTPTTEVKTHHEHHHTTPTTYSPPVHHETHHETHSTPTYVAPVSTPTYVAPVVSTPTYVSHTPVTHGPRLDQGGRLSHGDSLNSNNHLYKAIMQSDGNFVLYKGSTALWSSSTHNTGAKVVILQDDHNLVVYDGSTPKWASNTNGKASGTAHLDMQDDGNLVLYVGSHALWASGTVQPEEKKHRPRLDQDGRLGENEFLQSNNGHFKAIMQGDGNFVVYKGSVPKWASNTNGTGAKFVVLQGDHNLVIYDGSSSAKWASNTNGKGSGSAHLDMQDDGNLVLYDGSHALWASNTNE